MQLVNSTQFTKFRDTFMFPLKRTARALIGLSIVALSGLPGLAAATPVDYQFSFYGDVGYWRYHFSMGEATVSYDSNTHLFSNFLVPISGQGLTHTFDFTNQANNSFSDIGGSRCTGSTTAAEQMFDFLSQKSCSLYGQGWLPWAVVWDGSTAVYIEASGGNYGNGYHVRQNDPSGQNFYYLGGEGFYGYATQIQEVHVVPEPSDLALVALALGSMFLATKQRRSKRQSNTASSTDKSS